MISLASRRCRVSSGFASITWWAMTRRKPGGSFWLDDLLAKGIAAGYLPWWRAISSAVSPRNSAALP